MALSLDDPEPINMANNSEFESDRMPETRAFSLGLSASAKSLIENVFIMRSFDRYEIKGALRMESKDQKKNLVSQGPVQILYQIIHRLDAYTQPDERICKPCFESFLPGNGSMSHACRMTDQ